MLLRLQKAASEAGLTGDARASTPTLAAQAKKTSSPDGIAEPSTLSCDLIRLELTWPSSRQPAPFLVIQGENLLHISQVVDQRDSRVSWSELTVAASKDLGTL